MIAVTRLSCLVLCLAFVDAGSLAAEVKKEASGRVSLITRDASGRVQREVAVEPDGSQLVTTHEYWDDGKGPKRSLGEAVDRGGRARKRTIKEFDRQGRLRVHKNVAIDDAGAENGTVTRYDYDERGRGRENVSRVGK